VKLLHFDSSLKFCFREHCTYIYVYICKHFLSFFRYFVPEDGDTEQYPNVYLAPKNPYVGRPPTLGQIKASFPLPGEYHFRFKAPLVPGSDHSPNAVSVWMDCIDVDQPVNVWRNGIVAKVTRISMNNVKFNYTVKKPQQQQHRPPPASQPHHHHQQQHPQQSRPPAHTVPRVSSNPVPAPVAHPEENLLGVFDHTPHPQSAPVSAHSSSADLLGDATGHSQAAAPSGGNELLDFGNDNGAPKQTYGDDLLGMGGHSQAQHQHSFPF